MLRKTCLWAIGALAAYGHQGVSDPVFDKVPFEQWLKGGDDARMKWSARVMTPRLSAHQRMTTTLWVSVNGAEFMKRSGAGRLVVFFEIRDQSDRVYRTHKALDLAELKNPGSLEAVILEQHAYVKPGDYQVVAAIYDIQLKEHSLKRMKLHVAELSHDPLPEAWRDVPPVDFLISQEPPDRWFLPEIESRLNLPVETAEPVRIEVVVNESPTEAAMKRSGRMSTRNMGNLIPALKVISQMDVRNGSLNVTMLDLERRKVGFTQEKLGTLNWLRIKAALAENDPNKIDVHELEEHTQNAQFFVSEVRKRLERGDKASRVLIVLSGPMTFAKGQDLRPIEATPEPGTRVFYIRYYSVVPSRGMPPPLGPPGRLPPVPGPGGLVEDSLERTLKPLAPRLFNVTTPMEFRNALAAIIGDISQLK